MLSIPSSTERNETIGALYKHDEVEKERVHCGDIDIDLDLDVDVDLSINRSCCDMCIVGDIPYTTSLCLYSPFHENMRQSRGGRRTNF